MPLGRATRFHPAHTTGVRVTGLSERFFNRFDGLRRAHGSYTVGATATSGKIGGKALTLRKPVTPLLWEEHLAGRIGIGIVPIRDDSTCVFGAIDIDVYPLDLAILFGKVRQFQLPLIVCRTKSGGAHLYLFLANPTPAIVVRRKLSEWAKILGYPKSEIFPKQDVIGGEDDIGNWINMPYQAGELSMRYAVDPDGKAMSPEAFLDLADLVASRIDDLQTTDAHGENRAQLPGAPPCLVRLAVETCPAGTRNSGLYNYGIYAKKAFPSRWEQATRFYNETLMKPPLDDNEVEVIIKSVGKKRYAYKCKDQPICDVCDRPTCLTREFGISGGGEGDVGIEFGELTRVLTKPVTWLWDLNKEVVEFSTESLMNQAAFQQRLVEVLCIYPLPLKPRAWRELVQTRLSRSSEIEVPEDATVDGQLWEYLQRFCTGRATARTLDELLLGKPFTDENRSYFVVTDFLQYLATHRFPSKMNERLLYVSLREHKLEHHRTPLKGIVISYWSVPAFKTQTEDHTPPRVPQEGAM